VMRFDIKVWDDAAGLGPDGQPGFAFDDPTTLAVNEADDDQSLTPNDVSEIGWPGSDDGAFVDLGHNGFIYGGSDRSFYSRINCNVTQMPQYCMQNPNKPAGNWLYRFDTWNPQMDLDKSGGTPDAAPFRAPDAPAAWGNLSQRRPLKAIRITITFLDPTTQQLRDITLVASLRPHN